MEIFYSRDGEKQGPYTKEEIRAFLKAGNLSKEDVVWYEGLETWTPIGELMFLYAGIKAAPVLSEQRELFVETPAQTVREKAKAPESEAALKPRETPSEPKAPGNRRVRLNPLAGQPPLETEEKSNLFYKCLPWILAVVGLYFIYPYYTIFSLKKALQVGDAVKLEQLVDFPAVRESAKEQLQAYAMRTAAKSGGASSLVSGLAAAFGPMLLNGVVDNLVTPTGIATLIQESKKPKSGPNSPAPSRGGFPPDSDPNDPPLKQLEIEYAFFTGPGTFLVVINQVRIYLRFTGWSWQVFRIEPEKWPMEG